MYERISSEVRAISCDMEANRTKRAIKASFAHSKGPGEGTGGARRRRKREGVRLLCMRRMAGWIRTLGIVLVLCKSRAAASYSVQEVVVLLGDVQRPARPSMGCVTLEVRSGSSEGRYDCVDDKFKLPWPVEMIGDTFHVIGTARTKHGDVSVKLTLESPKKHARLKFSLDFKQELDPNCTMQDILEPTFAITNEWNTCLSGAFKLPHTQGMETETYQCFSIFLAAVAAFGCFLITRLSGRMTLKVGQLHKELSGSDAEVKATNDHCESWTQPRPQSKSETTDTSQSDPIEEELLCVQRILPRSKRLMLHKALMDNGYASIDDESSGFSAAED